jgi:uncharacterized protein
MSIENLKNQGIFFDIGLRKPAKKGLELVFLFDYDGSMSPFQIYGRQLLESACLGLNISNIKAYYFHNVPDGELYLNSSFNIPIPELDFLANLSRDRSFVIIFSDAGAAKRGMNDKRVLNTQSFLLG